MKSVNTARTPSNQELAGKLFDAMVDDSIMVEKPDNYKVRGVKAYGGYANFFAPRRQSVVLPWRGCLLSSSAHANRQAAGSAQGR